MSVERVTYTQVDGKRRTVLLDGIADTTVAGEPAIIGTEVDRDGCPVEPSAAYLAEYGAETGTVQHLVMTECVTRRVPMAQDLIYGGFVPAGAS